MQTEAAAAQDTEALLKEQQSKSKQRLSTFQWLLIVFIAMVISAIATNMDRIIDAVNNKESNPSSDSVNQYEFGHTARDLFALDTDYTEFNFGAYGNAPNDVMDYQKQIRLEIESCPSCWFRNNREETLNELLQRLAEYLGIEDWRDLAFIINASHGMNAVLRSITQKLYNDNCRNNITTCKVLQFSTAYGMVKQTINFINNDPLSINNQMIQFDITKPMMSNTTYLLEKLKIFLDDTLNGNNITIYLASISHIASVPSVLYDVQNITQLFRSYGIITLIDAAHSMGAIDINIAAMDPDIWLSNGHKWLYSTRGSAVIYVKKQYQKIIFPIVISRDFKSNSMQQQFHYQGTMDDSIWMSMNEALYFREKFGDKNIIQYLHNICIDGGNVLTAMWNTSLLIYNEENIGSMINPILPTDNGSEAQLIGNILENEYNTIIPIVLFEGEWYMRLCCQIYHEIYDFQWLGNAVKQILNDIRQN